MGLTPTERVLSRAAALDAAAFPTMKRARIINSMKLLDALGLKVVPAHWQRYDSAHIEHLQYFAQRGMAQPQAPIAESLEWE